MARNKVKKVITAQDRITRGRVRGEGGPVWANVGRLGGGRGWGSGPRFLPLLNVQLGNDATQGATDGALDLEPFTDATSGTLNFDSVDEDEDGGDDEDSLSEEQSLGTNTAPWHSARSTRYPWAEARPETTELYQWLEKMGTQVGWAPNRSQQNHLFSITWGTAWQRNR